ncbi:hypothetical protein SAMN00790413_03419 [Deinococcus hopiensis KR-140]|uniref:Uncharacterized protein n=1 Tax=Deinococcus hopiensis KR-140 TaxID=695939 RepID=A0A1W1UWE4_9DEIO|nr:hypothetical protein SAMN00790413_03419 [Deinococcus hopiensis KR-140]
MHTSDPRPQPQDLPVRAPYLTPQVIPLGAWSSVTLMLSVPSVPIGPGEGDLGLTNPFKRLMNG